MRILEMIVRERRVECPCRRAHRKKFAKVMTDMREKKLHALLGGKWIYFLNMKSAELALSVAE